MTDSQFQMLLEESRSNRAAILDLVERVARLEVKYTVVSALFGACGGLVPVIGAAIWYILSK